MPQFYERDCDQCGRRYRGGGAKFCSRSCRTICSNLSATNPAKNPGVQAKISAARAGKPTTAGRSIPESQRLNISAALRGRTLTDEHKAAIGAGVRRAGCVPPRNVHLIGPAHPNWLGGTRPARQADFATTNYKSFRAAVMDRDKWTCQDCGKVGGRLHAHHLKSWAENASLRYDPANGVALCPRCHVAKHRGVPRPKGAGPRTVSDLRSARREA